MLTIIKGGRVIDPGNLNSIMDIHISGGKIIKVIETGNNDESADRIINAAGKIVTPGLIDMHVHLREPGHEYKETIASGALAAVHGGITAICCMPNTNPVNDNRQITEFIIKKSKAASAARVYPVAAISHGLEGKVLNEYGDLKQAGAVALSDDGMPVTDSQLMRRAMEYAKGFGLLIISHCEDPNLVADGVINEGAVATRMGLAGIPNAAESVMVKRDIALCELTGSPLHIAHVSTKESVAAIREAKKNGIPVTAETAPHYFILTENAVGQYDTFAKMNPPLRSEEDRKSICEGLSDGTIDVIATDHAPHSILEKDIEFDMAANGIIGLETSLSLSLQLVDDGILSMEGLVEKMSKNPARILGFENGIQADLPADITIIDPDTEYVIDVTDFRSKSVNTPFNGMDVKGKAVLTIVGGKIVFDGLE